MTATKTTKPAGKRAPKAAAKPDLAQVQAKAKEFFVKGTHALDEVKDFTKGNVDALVASGKILGLGIKHLGSTYAAEGRSLVETAKGDFAELKAVQSPVDFFALHNKVLGRNLRTAIDLSQKNGKAVLDLAKASAEPLSRRVDAVAAAVRKAA